MPKIRIRPKLHINEITSTHVSYETYSGPSNTIEAYKEVPIILSLVSRGCEKATPI